MATATGESQTTTVKEEVPATDITTSVPAVPASTEAEKDTQKPPPSEDCGCDVPVQGPVSDALPSAEDLAKISELKLFDQNHKEYTFRSVYAIENVDKHLIIFIRHFVCGLCQDYLLTLSHLLPPSVLPPRTQISIIGHGDPSLLPKYAAVTQCPYPMYTDPSQKIYKAFSLLNTLKMSSRSKYQRQSFISMFFGGIFQGLTSGKNPRALGMPNQVGGEFLMVRQGDNWKVDWGHRMKFTNDHSEVEQLAKILDVEKLAELDSEQEQKLKKVGLWEQVSVWRNAELSSKGANGTTVNGNDTAVKVK